MTQCETEHSQLSMHAVSTPPSTNCCIAECTGKRVWVTARPSSRPHVSTRHTRPITNMVLCEGLCGRVHVDSDTVEVEAGVHFVL